MTAVTAVRAHGLSKRYLATSALADVELTVPAGEVHGLLGPNGAGKTTLLRLLLGLVAPDTGRIELLGRELRAGDASALAGVAGFVEEPRFYPYLSGRGNLELLAELDDGRPVDVEATLDRLGLRSRGGDRVGGYSTGMRQRLGIAACLLRSPRLLLLDEPTAGLDPAGIRDMEALVRELSGDGVAVVVSSHQIGEVDGICDAFTVLSRGQVVWQGDAGTLRAQAPAPAYRLRTSDDARAQQLARQSPTVSAGPAEGGGLQLMARDPDRDAFVLALGRAGVAVRVLEELVSPLEAMFFALTDETAAGARGR